MNYNYPTNYPTYPQNANMGQFSQSNQQIQNGGYMRVSGKDAVINFLQAPGVKMTFISEDETAMWTKTTGFSPFEAPRIEEYEIVKKEPTPPPAATMPVSKEDFDKLMERINALEKKGEEDNV